MNYPDARDFMNPDASDVVNLHDALLKELTFTRKLVYDMRKIIPEQVFVDVFAFCILNYLHRYP